MRSVSSSAFLRATGKASEKVSSTAIGDHFTREINDQVERIKSEFDAPYEAAVKALYDFPAVQDDERNNLLELVEP